MRLTYNPVIVILAMHDIYVVSWDVKNEINSKSTMSLVSTLNNLSNVTSQASLY